MTKQIDPTYPDQLIQIGTKLLEEYKGAKQHHDMKCLRCEYEWNTTPVFIKRTNKVYGTNGCPDCKLTRELKRFGLRRLDNIMHVEDRGFEIISEWSGARVKSKDSIQINVTVKNKKCGHNFTSSAINLISNNVNCPICNKEEKIKRLNASTQARSELYQLTANNWDKYRREVYKLTRETYKEHKQTINPTNLPRGKAGIEGAYHLDHIVPIRYCFDNNIPEHVCAYYENLQMLKWTDNIKSRDKLKKDVKIPQILQEYIS